MIVGVHDPGHAIHFQKEKKTKPFICMYNMSASPSYLGYGQNDRGSGCSTFWGVCKRRIGYVFVRKPFSFCPPPHAWSVGPHGLTREWGKYSITSNVNKRCLSGEDHESDPPTIAALPAVCVFFPLSFSEL